MILENLNSSEVFATNSCIWGISPNLGLPSTVNAFLTLLSRLCGIRLLLPLIKRITASIRFEVIADSINLFSKLSQFLIFRNPALSESLVAMCAVHVESELMLKSVAVVKCVSIARLEFEAESSLFSSDVKKKSGCRIIRLLFYIHSLFAVSSLLTLIISRSLLYSREGGGLRVILSP